jgi:hypothetical protein
LVWEEREKKEYLLCTCMYATMLFSADQKQFAYLQTLSAQQQTFLMSKVTYFFGAFYDLTMRLKLSICI